MSLSSFSVFLFSFFKFMLLLMFIPAFVVISLVVVVVVACYLSALTRFPLLSAGVDGLM